MAEDRVLHPSRLRYRDYVVITFAAPGDPKPPPVSVYLANHKPDLDPLPAERDLVDVPYVVEDPDHKGQEPAVQYFDPPHTGPAISYGEVLTRQATFLYLGPQKDVRRDQAYASHLLAAVANSARDQKGPDYARGMIARLHEHRWVPGSRLTGYLLIQADGGIGGQFYRRANDGAYLTTRINDLRARIDRAKSEVTNLTEWAEALYRLSPEVQEVMAYLKRSEVEKVTDWHRYFAQIDRDIMSVHRLNLNAVTRQVLGVATAPTWRYAQHLIGLDPCELAWRAPTDRSMICLLAEDHSTLDSSTPVSAEAK